MPRVRNPVGREYMVPPDHWALTDPEFVVLPDPEPEPEPEREPEPKPAPAPKRKRT
jgi:hypothetical protein